MRLSLLTKIIFKMKKISLFILLSLIFLFFSCKKDVEQNEIIEMGYHYFPDDIGRYVIYEVDSVAYDDKAFNPPKLTRYLLKEMITSSFQDNSGRPTLRIERFKKMYNDSIPYDSMIWIGPKVWHSNKTSSTAEKVEENIRYIKLVFPIKEAREWDGNSYNTLGQKNYEIISIDEPEIIGNLHFDSVVTVNQFEKYNFIEYIHEFEKYAKNVGLIFRKRDSLYWGSTPNDTIGYTFTQKIVSFGK